MGEGVFISLSCFITTVQSVALLKTQGTLTLRLLLVRRDGADEVLRRHVHLGLAVLADDLQRREVAEDLVRGGVGSDAVLVLHHLQQRHSYTIRS